ncbi:MAG: PAS domain S-box protein [Deltaproteobacteria bacterium]|nr:PAS domain S-box protein [Deltaproteobacteria bacterium]MBW1951767.1 PAS domain S-box protein [Deltaproteobacteria bacterium]MBW1986837.1 PAS domain S-box protein [Deltaproteobacteria bacterium]MBW2134960.1 PAS domain S-box protein [Deltaproteobacteria bacterium]
MFNIISKKVYLIVITLTVILLAGAFIFGLLSAEKMRDIISEQFNQQQLTIAKGVASDIEDKIFYLKGELHTLNLSPSVQYLEVSWPNRMRITMANVSNLGVIGIGLLDAEGRQIYWVNAQGESRVIKGNYSQSELLAWAKQPEHRNQIIFQRTGTFLHSTRKQNPYLVIFTPTYQISLDASHPQATGRFAGCLYFLVDPYQLIQKLTKDIRSGHSGYAWVIDSRGYFIYHPEEGFIGRSAFEVREQRAPKISFAEINKIQREKMLAGQEGVSWYWSGWHRGIVRKMKKFIAYAPIILKGDNGRIIWSVAVVAPQSEVEGAIHDVYIRQFLLQGVVIFIIILGGGTVIYYESRWSAALEKEVHTKTAALEKSKNELAKSEKLYKSLVESAEDAILNVDAKGEIVSINPYGAKILGYTPQGIMGKTISDVFPGNTKAELNRLVEEVIAQKQGQRATEELTIGGKEYFFNFNLTPIRENDRVLSVMIIGHDITSQKKFEEQLYHTEKLASLGQLAAGVAHEINNPLAIILGFADMLLEKIDENSKEYNIIKTIERQGNNCKKIVENLMTFARAPEKDQYDTDVNRSVETVLEVVKNTLLTKKVKYHLDLAEGLPKARGDAAQLQQVVLNLINNAVMAMPQGGHLTISTRLNSKHDRVEIVFADTGEGIKKENLPKIYDPFFTTRKVGEGTGLGLSVSYAIITKFGGTITCESKTKEESKDHTSGTKFTITLPIAQL